MEKWHFCEVDRTAVFSHANPEYKSFAHAHLTDPHRNVELTDFEVLLKAQNIGLDQVVGPICYSEFESMLLNSDYFATHRRRTWIVIVRIEPLPLPDVANGNVYDGPQDGPFEQWADLDGEEWGQTPTAARAPPDNDTASPNNATHPPVTDSPLPAHHFVVGFRRAVDVRVTQALRATDFDAHGYQSNSPGVPFYERSPDRRQASPIAVPHGFAGASSYDTFRYT